jgi:hypothetical protein
MSQYNGILLIATPITLTCYEQKITMDGGGVRPNRIYNYQTNFHHNKSRQEWPLR